MNHLKVKISQNESENVQITMSYKDIITKPGVVAHTFNPRIPETKADRLSEAQAGRSL